MREQSGQGRDCFAVEFSDRSLFWITFGIILALKKDVSRLVPRTDWRSGSLLRLGNESDAGLALNLGGVMDAGAAASAGDGVVHSLRAGFRCADEPACLDCDGAHLPAGPGPSPGRP